MQLYILYWTHATYVFLVATLSILYILLFTHILSTSLYVFYAGEYIFDTIDNALHSLYFVDIIIV